jgi:ATP-dependent helicase/nuclease subunit B
LEPILLGGKTLKILCSPNTEDVETYIKSRFEIGKKPLHLVPTMILYRRRLKFYFSFLRPLFNQTQISSKEFDIEEAIRQYVELFEVDQYIKHMVVSASSSSTLSNSEATVILERIINQIPETNNLSWKSVIYDLARTFEELSLSGLSLNTLRNFDNSRKWQQALDIYELFLEELQLKQLADYGMAANTKINELDVSIYDELILDGAFLPLSSKHQRIINKFIELKKPITIFLPYDLSTPDQPASKAIEDIYQNFLPKTEWESIQDKTRSSSFFIDRLPKLIFRDAQETKLDNSVSFLRFATLEEELSYIMRQVYVLVKYKEVNPRQVVILTPNAMELRPLIREISEQNNLKVRLPQRPFMHLAQGRAIKYLYDIHTDIRKLTDSYLNITMFKNFISGTLLRCNVGLSDSFEKIESFFVDCISIADWKSVFAALNTTKDQLIPEKYPHHPINSVEPKELKDMFEVIQALEEISNFLINISERTVKEHVRVLIKFLKEDNRFIELEGPIQERLSKITESLGAQERIPITAMEFGERISALFTEQEDFEAGEKANVEEDDSDIFLDREILVTGPNNVEFQRYEYVYVCRFTQDVYPEPKKFDWLITKEIEYKIISNTTCFKLQSSKQLENFYLNRSLYHIHLMFCAANTQLTISYSQIDYGVALTPAHYLHDIAKVFGLEEGNKLENKKAPGLEELLIKSRVLKCPSSIKPLSHNEINILALPKMLDERDFTVEEIAIYKYCPRRFYYQKKYQKENVYSQLFHLQSYASSCLYEKSVELLVLDQPKAIHEMIDQGKQHKRFLEKTKEYRMEAEKLIRPLFPLSNRLWSNVTSQTDFFLSTLMHWVFDNPYIREYRKSGNNNVTLQFFLSDHEKQIKIDDYTFTATKEFEVQYNHGEIHRYSISNRKDILSFSSNDHDEREHMKETKEWYDRFKRSFYNDTAAAQTILTEITNKLSVGKFDKNAGGHCKYCTFNKLCHEREVDI